MKSDSSYLSEPDLTNPVVQAMSPAQKLHAAWRLNVSARQLKAAALRDRHPGWTEDQVRRAVRDAFLYARG